MAASFLDNLTAPFTGAPIQQAAADKQALLEQGRQAQLADLSAGRNALSTNYTAALQPWNALQPAATGGYQAYADATGANGPEGQLRAQQQFQNFDPGAVAARDIALKTMGRSANARGVAAGNDIYGEGQYASDWAGQQYNNYVNRLLPFLNQSTTIAGGLSNINTGLGNALNANYTGQGAANMAAYTGEAGAKAEGDLAPMTAGSNIWTGMGKAASLASGLGGFGGPFGAGGAFSPGGAFGGGGSPVMAAAPASPQDWQRYPGNSYVS